MQERRPLPRRRPPGKSPMILPPGTRSFNTRLSNYSVEWSPFADGLLAVASAQHYGIIGNGRLFILEVLGDGLNVVRAFDTQDGLYDCTWSEANENHIVSASGDGTIKLWDLKAPPNRNPLRAYAEHTHEVYSVDWNMVAKDSFISGSWDNSIKLWTPERAQSISTWREHKYCIYSTVWAPQSPTTFASASGDYTVKIWDAKAPTSVQTLNAHRFEILTCDWSKYKDYELVTGSVDKTVRIWDLRKPGTPVFVLSGHNLAVRRVKSCPHDGNVFCSVAYDGSACIWDLANRGDPLIQRLEIHSEFVVGVDWNIFHEGQIATASWDEQVHIFGRKLPT